MTVTVLEVSVILLQSREDEDIDFMLDEVVLDDEVMMLIIFVRRLF